MSPTRWDESFDAGMPELGEQHRKLIDMINLLNRVIDSGHAADVLARLFTGLIASATEHFHEEEQHMREVGFPGGGSHKREHDELTGKANELNSRLATGQRAVAIEVQQFLRDYMKGHLLGTDALYAPYLEQVVQPVCA